MDRTVWSQITIALACGFLSIAVRAGAEDFRVDTKVYAGGERLPQVETRTLFVENKVYDVVLTRPQEIAILDLQARRFELLDTGRKAATGIACDDLLRWVAELQVWAQSKSELFQFAAAPEFQESHDPAQGAITLKSPVMSYEVATTAPPRPGMAGRYQQFADWYARLNTTHRGALPPAARLRLNEVLAKKNVLPSSVRQQLLVNDRVVLDRRSDHVFAMELQDEDLLWVKKAESFRQEFRQMPFFEYRPADKTAVARKSAGSSSP
jgi:hypothetical protein